jgi:hypothetical protein
VSPSINQIEGNKHFIYLARIYGMKKSSSIEIQPSRPTASDPVDSSKPSKVSEHMVSVPLRTHASPTQSRHFFAVVPDIDTETMLCQASETLACLSAMATDLARELEGPRRQLILTIQQMSALGELLVNRALDTLELPRESSDVPSTCQY